MTPTPPPTPDDKLLGCPFCGSPPKLICSHVANPNESEGYHGYDESLVYCKGCKTSGPSIYRKTFAMFSQHTVAEFRADTALRAREEDRYAEYIKDVERQAIAAWNTRAALTPQGPTTQWRCFHCDETFTDKKLAAEHFGASEIEEAGCKMLAKGEVELLRDYRDMAARWQRCVSEDCDASRLYHSMSAKIATAERDAEQKGYDKGLADGRAEKAPTPTADDTKRLRGIIERERSRVADLVSRLRTALDARQWLLEGRGSFAWDDNDFRKEFAAAVGEVKHVIAQFKPMAADWSDCPTNQKEVEEARQATADDAAVLDDFEDAVAERTRLRDVPMATTRFSAATRRWERTRAAVLARMAHPLSAKCEAAVDRRRCGSPSRMTWKLPMSAVT